MTNQNLTLTLTMGLPASGKTTWAEQQDPKQVMNICKDNIREENNNSIKEKDVIAIRDCRTIDAFIKGLNVIWSDTNFNPIHLEIAKEIAKKYNATVIIKDFSHISLSECLKRDSNRAKYVGEKVIRDMYNKYLRPEIKPVIFNDILPSCIICDIDGTIAKMGKRSPYDWGKVGIDTPIQKTINIVKGLYNSQHETKLFFFSGRDSICREETIKWIEKHVGISSQDIRLMMRPEKDQRPDTEIKLEIYNNEIKDKYNVIAIFDDRLSVCRQWHNLGLPLFRVGDPESNF